MHTHTCKHTHTHPAVKNLLLRPLWISTTRPCCIRLHPFIQHGRAGSVGLGSWTHEVAPTARCVPGKLNKLWVGLGSGKTHDVAQHMIACIKPEEAKKRKRVEGWRRKVDFLQQCCLAGVWVCRADSQLWNLECKATRTTKAEKRRGREEDPSHAAQTTPKADREEH